LENYEVGATVNEFCHECTKDNEDVKKKIDLIEVFAEEIEQN
jgi:hypothetical protein